MTLAQLKNGKVLPLVLVQTTCLAIKALIEEDPIAYTHLLESAMDPSYTVSNMPDDIREKILKNFITLSEGVRDIVLSAFDKKNMSLCDPVSKIINNNVDADILSKQADSSIRNNPVAAVCSSDEKSALSCLNPNSESVTPPSSASAVLIAGATMKSDATLTAKMLNYLSDNKYKALFIVVLVGYGIYDHYHENYIGKTAIAVKKRLFSLWKNEDCTAIEKNHDQAQKEASLTIKHF